MPMNGGDDSSAEWPLTDGLPVEDAYRYHAALLRDIAHKKFRVPPSDAESLVNEVFVAFLLRGMTVRDPRKWLIGAVCHASRGYWRTAARTLPLPPDIDEYADSTTRTEEQLVDNITVAAAISHLGDKCRETLRLYYAEGYSAAEIADLLGTTTGYVMQLLHSCRKRCREVYTNLTEGKT